MYVTVTTQKQKLTKAIILIYSCSENFAYKCIMACIYTKIRGQFSFINQDQTHPVELGKGAGAHRLTLIPGIDQSCVAHRSSKFSVTISQSFAIRSKPSFMSFCSSDCTRDVENRGYRSIFSYSIKKEHSQLICSKNLLLLTGQSIEKKNKRERDANKQHNVC